MLKAVRPRLILLTCLFIAAQLFPAAQQPVQQSSPSPTQPAAPPTQPQPQQQPPPAPRRHTLVSVVLDPGHGGTDSGARGEGGLAEKDITLELAQAARAELVRQGFRVVMTRQGDENPYIDDRAALANAQSDAIFVSFHVSSTGPVGTARAYCELFETPVTSLQPAAAGTAAMPPAHPPGSALLWEQAQLPYVDASHKLADLLQSELARTFPGSTQLSTAIPERSLRSVAMPAVAVEISSVAAPDSKTLDAMAGPLASAIARATIEFRPIFEAGPN